MILGCAVCRVAITEPLTLLQDRSMLTYEYMQPHLPERCYYTVLQETCIDDGGHMHTREWYVVNIASLCNTTSEQEEFGCCGLDGADLSKPNCMCNAGHMVGVEQSECYMAHRVLLDAAAVVVLEGSEQPRMRLRSGPRAMAVRWYTPRPQWRGRSRGRGRGRRPNWAYYSPYG
eukprot:m.123922 g.123922  ORF g.123922 m.123922 type:complete len:174 (-) comp9338_c0_seq1:1273-1794(-)